MFSIVFFFLFFLFLLLLLLFCVRENIKVFLMVQELRLFTPTDHRWPYIRSSIKGYTKKDRLYSWSVHFSVGRAIHLIYLTFTKRLTMNMYCCPFKQIYIYLSYLYKLVKCRKMLVRYNVYFQRVNYYGQILFILPKSDNFTSEIHIMV